MRFAPLGAQEAQLGSSYALLRTDAAGQASPHLTLGDIVLLFAHFRIPLTLGLANLRPGKSRSDKRLRFATDHLVSLDRLRRRISRRWSQWRDYDRGFAVLCGRLKGNNAKSRDGENSNDRFHLQPQKRVAPMKGLFAARDKTPRRDYASSQITVSRTDARPAIRSPRDAVRPALDLDPRYVVPGLPRPRPRAPFGAASSTPLRRGKSRRDETRPR